jgi:antitoxin component HigA of HigAB toxin-antitoxin module
MILYYQNTSIKQNKSMSILVFQDVVEGLLDANPIDRQYVAQVSKLSKRSLNEAKWISKNIWSLNQREDVHNVFFDNFLKDKEKGMSIYGSQDARYIQKGWLLSVAKIYNIQNARFNGNYLLRTVAKCGHIEILKYIVETYNLTIRDVRTYGNEALIEALDYNHSDIARYLIETFNLTVKDIRYDDNAVLRKAAYHGNLDVLRWLIEKFNLTVDDAKSVISSAIIGNELKVLKYLFSTFNLTVKDIKSLDGHFQHACYKGHLEMLRWFNEICSGSFKKASIRYRQGINGSGLFHNAEIVKYLTEMETK